MTLVYSHSKMLIALDDQGSRVLTWDKVKHKEDVSYLNWRIYMQKCQLL